MMGKNRVDFTRHKSPDVRVVIENAAKLVLTVAKKEETVYKRFSGHQGSKVKIETSAHLAERRGYKEGLKSAIKGMIPDNKLRPELLIRLTITVYYGNC